MRWVGFFIVGWLTVIGGVLLVAGGETRGLGLFFVLTGVAWFVVDAVRQRQSSAAQDDRRRALTHARD